MDLQGAITINNLSLYTHVSDNKIMVYSKTNTFYQQNMIILIYFKKIPSIWQCNPGVVHIRYKLMKRNLDSDGQQFHQYQSNEKSALTCVSSHAAYFTYISSTIRMKNSPSRKS